MQHSVIGGEWQLALWACVSPCMSGGSDVATPRPAPQPHVWVVCVYGGLAASIFRLAPLPASIASDTAYDVPFKGPGTKKKKQRGILPPGGSRDFTGAQREEIWEARGRGKSVLPLSLPPHCPILHELADLQGLNGKWASAPVSCGSCL